MDNRQNEEIPIRRGLPPGAIPIATIKIFDGEAVVTDAPTRQEALDRLEREIHRHIKEHGEPPEAVKGWRKLAIDTNRMSEHPSNTVNRPQVDEE